MKTAARLALVIVGVVFAFSMVGCPKKCVKPVEDEPVMVEEPEPIEVTEPEPEPEPSQLSLAPIYFDFDKYDIRPGDATILQGNAGQLKTVTGKTVTVEGHCDPVGTSEYNMALGMRRAESARAYLVKLGLSPEMFSTISFGEERLVTQDEAQFEKNRRCEFVVR